MNRKIKQIYIPYWEWEDYKNGMWRKLEKNEENEYLKKAIEFTGNHIKYGNAMKVVVNKWIRTMENSLTNPNINKRAFLGYCACSYKINCPEYIVRLAWKELNDKQRYLADKVAQQVINKYLIDYENKNYKLHQTVGTQMLLQWDS